MTLGYPADSGGDKKLPHMTLAPHGAVSMVTVLSIFLPEDGGSAGIIYQEATVGGGQKQMCATRRDYSALWRRHPNQMSLFFSGSGEGGWRRL